MMQTKLSNYWRGIFTNLVYEHRIWQPGSDRDNSDGTSSVKETNGRWNGSIFSSETGFLWYQEIRKSTKYEKIDKEELDMIGLIEDVLYGLNETLFHGDGNRIVLRMEVIWYVPS